MPNTVISTMVQTIAMILFFTIGWMILKKKTKNGYSRTTMMFAFWWIISGIKVAIGIFNKMMAEYGVFSVQVPLIYFAFAITSIGMFFLLQYSIVLFTGKEKWGIPLLIFYIAAATFVIVVMAMHDPYVITNAADGIIGTIAFRDALPISIGVVSIAALVLPQLLICIALYTLFFKLEISTQKYRVFLIATSIFLWFGSSLVASAAGASASVWTVINHFVELGAAAMIFLAYAPPAWLKKRHGIRSLVDELNEPNIMKAENAAPKKMNQ